MHGTYVDAVRLHLLVVVLDGVKFALHLTGHRRLAPLRELAEGAVVLDGQVARDDGDGDAVLAALLRTQRRRVSAPRQGHRVHSCGSVALCPLPSASGRTLTQATVRSMSKKNWVMIKSAPASILPFRRSRSSWRACSEGGRSGWFHDSMWTSG